MSKDELFTYLKAAIDLETDITIQKTLISDYKKQNEKIKPQLEHKDKAKKIDLCLIPYTGYFPNKFPREYKDFPLKLLFLGIGVFIFVIFFLFCWQNLKSPVSPEY